MKRFERTGEYFHPDVVRSVRLETWECFSNTVKPRYTTYVCNAILLVNLIIVGLHTMYSALNFPLTTLSHS